MTDPHFERSLRAAARRAQTGGVHPDASLLAAYADRGLSDAERADLEAHVADCAECMERLALLGSVNVADEPEPPSFEWSPRELLSRWGWLVPVATVVVLVAIWERQPTSPSSSGGAVSSAAEKPATIAAAPRAPEAANRPAPAQTGAASDRAADAPVAEQEEARKKASARQVAQPPAAKDAKAKPGMQMQARRPETPSQFGAAPAAGGNAQEAVTLRDKKQLDAATAPRPAEAAASVAGRADEAKAGKEPRAQKTDALRETAAQGALLKSELDAPVILVARQDLLIRRLGSRIERSTDRGVTWTLDLADAPAGVQVGACPTVSVCWLGGSQGIVLVRQASGAWMRHVVGDGRAAVRAIDAIDAVTATVRLSDGRRFETADGGATWAVAQ